MRTWLLLSLALALIVSVVAANALRPRWEARLLSSVQKSLEREGLKAASIRASWREVQLQVYGANPQVIRRFYEQAAKVSGVSSVKIESLPFREPSLQVRAHNGRMTVTGLLAEETLLPELETFGRQFSQGVETTIDRGLDVNTGEFYPLLRSLFAVWTEHQAQVHAIDLRMTEGRLAIQARFSEPTALIETDAVLKKQPGLIQRVQRRLILEPLQRRLAGSMAPTRTEQSLDGGGRVFFQFGTTEFNDDDNTIEQLSKTLKANPAWKVRIMGFTDNTGNEEFNRYLSKLRAVRLAEQLARAGIRKEALLVEAKGPTDFLADNSTLAGRQLNRRVEFQFIRG